MTLAEFKERIARGITTGVGCDEGQEVIIRIKRGGRKPDHYARIKYICNGTLTINGKNYTEIDAEYITP